jgi:hypothetical protein
MNKINQFFDKSPLWQVYIICWFLTGTLIASLFYFLQKIDATSPELVITGEACLKIGAMSGLSFGMMAMLMVSMMRKTTIFWIYAETVEELIDAAKTKDELTSIFNNEFQDLRKKCQGGPQIQELTRLHAIMKTKIKYIN